MSLLFYDKERSINNTYGDDRYEWLIEKDGKEYGFDHSLNEFDFDLDTKREILEFDVNICVYE